MNLENIKEGMIIKNYKEMCKLLKEDSKTSNSKKAQIKEWARYFKYHKDGHKFIIDEIFDKAKPREINIRPKKKYYQLKVSESNYNNIGVYMIKLNKKLYIGSTTAGFRKRFLAHKKLWHKEETKTYNLLKNEEATFEILENMTGKSEEEIRNRETEYIQHFKDREDIELINKMDRAFSHNPSQRKPKMKTIRYRIKKADYKNIKNKFDEILKEYGYEL